MPAFRDPDTYRDILDGLQIGVSVLDLQKTIVFWSDGAEQITGYSRIDVLGHDCTDNILLHCNQIGCEMCNEKCPITSALHMPNLWKPSPSFTISPDTGPSPYLGHPFAEQARLDHRHHPNF